MTSENEIITENRTSLEPTEKSNNANTLNQKNWFTIIDADELNQLLESNSYFTTNERLMNDERAVTCTDKQTLELFPYPQFILYEYWDFGTDKESWIVFDLIKDINNKIDFDKLIEIKDKIKQVLSTNSEFLISEETKQTIRNYYQDVRAPIYTYREVDGGLQNIYSFELQQRVIGLINKDCIFKSGSYDEIVWPMDSIELVVEMLSSILNYWDEQLAIPYQHWYITFDSGKYGNPHLAYHTIEWNHLERYIGGEDFGFTYKEWSSYWEEYYWNRLISNKVKADGNYPRLKQFFNHSTTYDERFEENDRINADIQIYLNNLLLWKETSATFTTQLNAFKAEIDKLYQ